MKVQWYEQISGTDNRTLRRGIIRHYLWDPDLHGGEGGAIAIVQHGPKLLVLPIDKLAVTDTND